MTAELGHPWSQLRQHRSLPAQAIAPCSFGVAICRAPAARHLAGTGTPSLPGAVQQPNSTAHASLRFRETALLLVSVLGRAELS